MKLSQTRPVKLPNNNKSPVNHSRKLATSN